MHSSKRLKSQSFKSGEQKSQNLISIGGWCGGATSCVSSRSIFSVVCRTVESCYVKQIFDVYIHVFPEEILVNLNGPDREDLAVTVAHHYQISLSL